MGNIGDTISTAIPAVGTSGTQYATDINAFLTEVKTRLEAKVPMSSLLTGALDMGNNNITNASYLHLVTAAGTPSTPSQSIQSFGGNLYWVSPSGAVQITNGATLNAAGIGGITGDYGGANPAQFRFVDADLTYYAYDNFSTGAWAYLRTRGIEIAGGATSAVRARIDWAGSSSYTLTLPTALPASQVILQVNSTGQISASNTLPVDTSITLSGTGKINHGDYVVTVHVLVADAVNVTGGPAVGTGALPGVTIPVSSDVQLRLNSGLPTNKRLKKFQVFTGAAPVGTIDYELYTTNSGGGTATFVSTGHSVSSAANDPTSNTLTFGVSEPLWLNVRTGVGESVHVKTVHLTFDAA